MTDRGIFNNFCRRAGRLIAKYGAVCNYIALFCKANYLLFTINTCFENFDYPFMNAEKIR